MGVRSTESLAASVRDRLVSSPSPLFLSFMVMVVFQCRKSMARLKYVINERRLLYDNILAAGEGQKKVAPARTTDPYHRVKSRRRSLPREAR